MEKCPKCSRELQFVTRTTAKDQKKLYRCDSCGYEELISLKKWKKIVTLS